MTNGCDTAGGAFQCHLLVTKGTPLAISCPAVALHKPLHNDAEAEPPSALPHPYLQTPLKT